MTEAALEWLVWPEPNPDVVAHWDAVVDASVGELALPLRVQKTGGDCGVEGRHASVRAVVCVGNAWAHWTLACALAGEHPTPAYLVAALTSGQWPVVFARASGGREASELQTRTRAAQARQGAR